MSSLMTKKMLAELEDQKKKTALQSINSSSGIGKSTSKGPMFNSKRDQNTRPSRLLKPS